MYSVRIMNSTCSGRTKVYAPDTTVLDIMEDPEVSGLLVGTTFAWNASTIGVGEFSKTLEELGAYSDKTNVLCAMKAATGSCK